MSSPLTQYCRNINKPTVSRQAAIFDIVDSHSATWDIKITEPAQCSVGLFVNWKHVKEQTLHDGDLIGLGLAGVLAYESMTHLLTYILYYILFLFFCCFILISYT